MFRRKGFTLIELMVAIAIIGILASLAIPVYKSYSGRAQLSEAMTVTSRVRSEIVSSYIAAKGTFIGIDSGTNGIPAANEISGNYVKSVSVTDSVVFATLGNNVADYLAGNVLTITPRTTSGDTIVWNCSFSGDSRYIPESCQ